MEDKKEFTVVIHAYYQADNKDEAEHYALEQLPFGWEIVETKEG